MQTHVNSSFRDKVTAAFDRAVQLILEFEGGALTNYKYDPGGLTKFGISQRAHPHLEIASLTREAAVAIYQSEYWLGNLCDRMPWHWALALFDAAVNHGSPVARHLAQQALGVPVDGQIGPHTLAAMAQLDSLQRLDDFFALRGALYAVNPSFAEYGHGWLRRLFVVHELALSGG